MKERSQLGLLARRERDMRTSALLLAATLATVSIAARGAGFECTFPRASVTVITLGR
jgi:hypothetical protein